jgi:hypothetical protein
MPKQPPRRPEDCFTRTERSFAMTLLRTLRKDAMLRGTPKQHENVAWDLSRVSTDVARLGSRNEFRATYCYFHNSVISPGAQIC